MPGGSLNFSGAQAGMPKTSEIIYYTTCFLSSRVKTFFYLMIKKAINDILFLHRI